MALIVLHGGDLGKTEAVLAFSLICAAQTLFLGRIASQRHRYTLTAPALFLASSFLFLTAMPLVASVVDYHFVMQPAQLSGTTRLVALNFWLISAYVLVYTAITRRTQVGLAPPAVSPSARELRSIKVVLAAGVLIGVVAFGTVFLRIGGLASLSYVEIAGLLEGENWRIRMAELLPASGVVIYLIGTVTGKRTRAVGLAMIGLFAVLRAPFQNRENVIKFFVILLIALQLKSRRKASTIVTAGVATIALVTLFSFPFLSALRGGVQVKYLAADYVHFVFRDLNFAEIAGAVLAEEEFDGAVGLERGLIATAGTLVPRRLWQEKPFTVGVQVTEWVTPVPGYDVTDPLFAYAPTYVGFAYVVGGIMSAIVLAALTAAVVALAIRWLGGQRRRTWPVDNALAALAVYYGAFAIVKLDPANVLTAGVCPGVFLVVVRAIWRLQSISGEAVGRESWDHLEPLGSPMAAAALTASRETPRPA